MRQKILTAFLIVVVMIGGLIIFSKFTPNSKLQFFTVNSGSMEPSIGVGSVIFTSRTENYKSGDVVTINSKENSQKTITHRIISVDEKDGEKLYQTKGDANDSADSELVGSTDIVGKVLYDIPLLGYPIMFAKSKIGLITLVIIPALIIIAMELVKIVKEIRSLESQKENTEPKNIPGKEKILGLILILIVGSLAITGTFSNFLDKGRSIENIFQSDVFEPQINNTREIKLLHTAPVESTLFPIELDSEDSTLTEENTEVGTQTEQNDDEIPKVIDDEMPSDIIEETSEIEEPCDPNGVNECLGEVIETEQ